ncbi:Holliday junction resolvase RuvX [Leptobacterium flavescens]|uniref:Putative pre-16S rRNA nuclease n=1 Tax=Leptobacterium flavescens TaxID=472055 RepID=A0A6P0UU18_9FLAO|nr:Holliday junction resolvase RuvX [Leptobacterium flavescens]NER15518.1 Holliday junction resolvase RuvX [Leptobacterium flavescens]
MGRILALDYGEKRTGVAVTDELQIIASGLTTVPTADLIPFLENYVQTETVSLIVVGEPKQMNNEFSESEKYIRIFLEKLAEKLPQVPVERVDERFTSKMAFQAMIDGGLSKGKRKNKELVDQISATIILQTYLENKQN